MLWPGMPLRIAARDLRHSIARNPNQARVPLAVHGCVTCRRSPGRGTSPDQRGYDDSSSHFQEFFVCQTAQQRGDVREDFSRAAPHSLGELIDEFAESDLSGAALDDLGVHARSNIRCVRLEFHPPAPGRPQDAGSADAFIGVVHHPRGPPLQAASVVTWIGSSIDASSFSGLLTRLEIGHIRISSGGNGRIRSRGSASSPSQRA